MPELPEVENVKRGLEKGKFLGQVISKIVSFRRDIRSPIPMKELLKLEGQKIFAISRRAKYLVFSTEKGNILSHLGMTGSWRLVKENEIFEKEKHDHFFIEFKNSQKIVFNDPRRFGLISFFKINEIPKEFLRLGSEPLNSDFNQSYLRKMLHKKNSSIKIAIMDQKIVVGVGNIYASEVLFLSQINPNRKSKNIKSNELIRLIDAIKTILQMAIDSGGSTIRDYANFTGEAGSFQQSHQVYGRANKKCFKCQSPIRKKVLGGRSTFWCPDCQK